MKIPYFYLEVGSVKIFQPLNEKDDSRESYTITHDETRRIRVVSTPELRSDTLYLNGGDRRKSFLFIQEQQYGPQLEPFLKLLRAHNEVN